jgi:uncharacterized RDD family membrane protein YckC
VRLISLVYETLLLVPVVFLSALLFLLIAHDASSTWMRPLFQLWLLSVVGLYFAYCWVRTGQTLAMKTWRIRVERRDGRLLSPRQAALRFVLACWTLIPGGLTLWWALIDRERQFLHDRLAGTRIVKVNAAPAGRSDPARG